MSDSTLQNIDAQEAKPAEGNSALKAFHVVSVGDVLAIAMRFWYWVLLSVIICTGLAVLSVKRAVPIYTRTCSVIVRDEAQSSVGVTSVDLSDIGVGGSNTILEDEMAALKSPDLMAQVVRKLNLTVSYSSPGTFHPNVLYGSNLPIHVSFPDMPDDERASLTVHVDENGNLSVTDMVVNRKAFVVPENAGLKFGSVIGTGSGRVIIEKTPFFKEGVPLTVNVSRMTLLDAAEAYESEIEIEQQAKKSNVVLIACNDANIERADDILTDLVKAYNQDWIRTRAEVVAVTSNFITDRLNLLESELGNVDSDISSFKSTNLIPDLTQTSTMALQQSSAAQQQISTLTNQLQMARYLRNYISTEGKNSVLPVNTGIGSGNIETAIGQYNAILIQRNSILTNTSENNPIIVDLDSRMAALRSSILSSLDNQVLALTTAISNLERNEQTANARVAANPRQAKYLLTAERQQKVKESLYLYLLQKREENELSQAFTSVNTRILRRPSGSKAPTYPKPMQTYAIGLIVGLLIPFGAIYAMETLNTRIRGRKDLDGYNVPILGEIPLVPHSISKWAAKFKNPSRMRDELPIEEDVVVRPGNRDLINEAFRVLRTNISFVTADSMPCVAMFTSFNPGSGKTFVALNAGLSMALKDKKVLLIDSDLRRGSLSRVVGSPKHGLADYLNGSVRDIDGLIIKDSLQPNLSVLPVGVFPPNPTELLESSRFSHVIDYLRTEYDYIFIDCPPVEMMADAQIIHEVADRTFFVIRVGLFERSMLQELETFYMRKKFRNMAVIVNGSDTASRYGDSYRYGYGYSKKNYKNYYRAKK